MARYLEIRLEKRDVACTAKLLDDEAPITSGIIWDSLPQGGQAYHAKYASNEVFCLVAPLSPEPPGLENPTITPMPGDVVYFYFSASLSGPQEMRDHGFAGLPGLVDLAIFYGRNNTLFSPQVGPVPGNVYARIVDNLAAMAAACDDVFRNGSAGERLTYRRLPS